jgi:hypothetical protein
MASARGAVDRTQMHRHCLTPVANTSIALWQIALTARVSSANDCLSSEEL